MDSFVIKGNEPEGRLEIRKAKSVDDYYVVFKRPGLVIRRKVPFLKGLDPLPDFLDVLKENWKGWEGALEWKSLESDFSLSCTHNKVGRVYMRVRIVTDQVSLSEARSTLGIELGQLDVIAKNAREFFAGLNRA